MTTRNLLALAAALASLAFSGCATPGPTHAYLALAPEEPVIDVLPGAPDAQIDTYLHSTNELYGMAYDPFTDHLFLRLYPGDFVRVIDRPAGKIKRGIVIHGLPAGRGDLAVRSIDRHLFLVHPTDAKVIETDMLGHIEREIVLENRTTPAAGLAYDQKNNRLLALYGGDLANISVHDLAGKRLGGVALDRNVRLTSLGYDSEAAEFYVPLAGDSAAIGIFDGKGHYLRSIAPADGKKRDFVDVGQRSLFRLF